MSASLTLVPAYGRDYKSKAEVVAAWNDGQDFVVADAFHPDNGRAVSIRESETLVSQGRTSVHIRYKRLTMIAVVAVNKGAQR